MLGGAPGYRPLAAGRPPQSEAGFAPWVERTLLDRGRALYSRVEAEFLLREDPRITHRTLYYDVLSAVARGASTPAKVSSMLERSRSAMVAPLERLSLGAVGTAEIADPAARTRHEVDVLALAPGERRKTREPPSP